MNAEPMTDEHRASYTHLPEFQEGHRAFYVDDSNRGNPYPWNNTDWWRNEAWEAGRQQAEIDAADDDDD